MARTFQVSLGWITRLGVLLSIITAVGLISSLLAIKYYRAVRYADPIRVRELEQELADLRVSYQSALDAQKKSVEAAPAPPAAQTVPVESPAPAPVPTVTVTVTPTAAAPQSAPVASGPGSLFSGLPAGTQPATGQIPIAVQGAKLSWSGRTLRVRFNIQYVLTDRGSQQGRIVLLARGPESLLAYPRNVFRKSGESSLVAPERGEYFSVSRIREVKADFGPMTSAGSLHEVEILLFNPNGQLLIQQRMTAEPATERAPKAPKGEAADPEQEDSDPADEPAAATGPAGASKETP